MIKTNEFIEAHKKLLPPYTDRSTNFLWPSYKETKISTMNDYADSLDYFYVLYPNDPKRASAENFDYIIDRENFSFSSLYPSIVRF